MRVIEVAMHYARRRHAPVTGEDLRVGLLADGSKESVRVLCRLGVDLGQLWSDLRRWHMAAEGIVSLVSQRGPDLAN
jgi:hypothetical protein